MASEDEEKLKTKERELQKKKEEIKRFEEKMDGHCKKIEGHRKYLWGKLESLILDLQKKHKNNLEIELRSLEQKKELSESEEELKVKIEHLISFFDRFKKFYDEELKPGLRNFKSFIKIFFYTWGVVKAKNNFHFLERHFEIIIYLNNNRILKIGPEVDIIKKIKEDLGVLPGLMIELERLLKDYKRLIREYKKLKKSK